MKSFLKSALVLIAIGLGLVASANAECISGCNSQQAPPTNTTTFMVGGASNFGGMGGAVFQGGEGFALVEKSGYSGVDLTVDASGSLCGIDCHTGTFNFNGYAGEHVKASAGALSNQSGIPAKVENMGNAFANVTMGVQKTQSGQH